MEEILEKTTIYYKDLDVTDLVSSKLLIPLEQFEPAAIDISKCLLMDAIVSLAAGYNGITDAERDAMISIMGVEPQLYRTAYPFEGKVSLEMSGFINSFLVRYVDWGDVMRVPEATRGTGGHPNDALAAVLTLLDVPGITGKKILELVRLSYELWITLFYNMMSNVKRKIDAASVIALSVPVLAAVAFDANPERAQNALNLSASMMALLGCSRGRGRSGEVKNIKNAACGIQIYKSLWAYRASELIECLDTTFTGQGGWYEHFAPFEGEFIGHSDMEVYAPIELKVWPMYGVAQTSVECAVALHSVVNDKLSDIEKIVLYNHKKFYSRISHDMKARYPQTHASADHNPYWGVAMGLKYGTVGLHHFEDKYYHDEDIVRMLGIMNCVPFEDRVIEKMDGTVGAAGIEVIMKDGTVYNDLRARHIGHYDGLTLADRAKRMSEVVNSKQKIIEEGYGYNLSDVAKIVYGMENQSGDALINAIHKALK